jgi:hypothetical protein
MDVPSNSRLALIPNKTPYSSRRDWYGNGPAAVPVPGGAAKGAHHEFVGNCGAVITECLDLVLGGNIEPHLPEA